MILRKVSDEEEYVCYKRTCRTSRSIRHGSLFSSSKFELNQIVLLLHLWSKIYPPEIIMEDFEFSKKTITHWSRFCRDLDLWHQKLEVRIEIDESLIVRRKYNRGRLPKQQEMFGGALIEIPRGGQTFLLNSWNPGLKKF
ncbi:hypothetical protein HZS_4913 [Henneguya salminicola]|nr:hypothetical protein HZS_4913 [Henneguya salminicola]